MNNPYAELGVTAQATQAELKAAYRRLVKQHHPDAGGDPERILALNAAWELLGDAEQRRQFDRQRGLGTKTSQAEGVAEARRHGVRNARASQAARAASGQGAAADDALLHWLQAVYAPVDRQLGQVINPFPAQWRALAADPYDDRLMEAFCAYIETSQRKLKTVKALYQSLPVPDGARGFGLSLYHCLSEVEDAVAELERYTMGYVDSYLHDGREMLRQAKQRRQRLQQERRRLELV
ncbi:MAG: J domain-containing protein [Synechococcus sp.]